MDYVLVSEVTKNVDAYRISTYFHRPAAGAPIHAGPLWDYNLAFGNADYGAATDPTVSSTRRPTRATPTPSRRGGHASSRATRSKPAPARAGRISAAAPSRPTRCLTWIDATAADLEDAQARNFERWPILDEDVWPNAFVGGTYAAEVDYLTEWLVDRLAWLDGEWRDENAERPDAALSQDP